MKAEQYRLMAVEAEGVVRGAILDTYTSFKNDDHLMVTATESSFIKFMNSAYVTSFVSLCWSTFVSVTGGIYWGAIDEGIKAAYDLGI